MTCSFGPSKVLDLLEVSAYLKAVFFMSHRCCWWWLLLEECLLHILIHRAKIFSVWRAVIHFHHPLLRPLVNWPSPCSGTLTHWFHFLYKTVTGKILPYINSCDRNLCSSSYIWPLLAAAHSNFLLRVAGISYNRSKLFGTSAFKKSLQSIVCDHCTWF